MTRRRGEEHSVTCKKSDWEIRGRLHLGEQPREELVLCGFDVKLHEREWTRVRMLSSLLHCSRTTKPGEPCGDEASEVHRSHLSRTALA